MNYLNYLTNICPILDAVEYAEANFMYEEFICNPNIQWYDIFDEGKLVGFVIIGIGNNTPPGTDLYLAECYVDSSAQNKGLMTRTIETILSEHNVNNFCMHIIKNNDAACKYWLHFAQKHNFSQFPIHDDTCPLYCDFYGFKQS